VILTLIVISLAGSFISTDLSNLLVQFGLLCLLATMLFLPPNGIHRKMLAQKKAEWAPVQAKIKELANGLDSEGASGAESSDSMDGVMSLLTLRALKEEVSRIPSWPFDTGKIERFVGVFLSVTSIILARLLQVALHLKALLPIPPRLVLASPPPSQLGWRRSVPTLIGGRRSRPPERSRCA
jgi:hypothetical protein